MNFREFLESTFAGAFTTDGEAKIPAYDGKLFPQVTLDFPTVVKRGEVFRTEVKGASYVFYLYDPHSGEGNITVEINRDLYKKRYNRLPVRKTNEHPGDMMTVVYYKYKRNGKVRHDLKDFSLDSLR